jgi:fluoride exporter
MRNIIVVGLGGCMGSVCRYLFSGWVQQLLGDSLFPYGTLSVNVLGCFTIGLLGGWADNAELFSPTTRAFLLIGVLGGFTTFSSFGYETMALMRDRQLLAASANVGLHIVVGFAAVALGYGLSNLRW